MSEIGLREQKKRKTRAAIQAEAMRLFTSQGYERTTCEQIAAAADVSPATLFRYFADKEDLVLADEPDPIFLASMDERPAGEPLITSIRVAMAEAFREFGEEDFALIRDRMQLVLSVPALRARMTDQLLQTDTTIVQPVADRLGAAPDSMRVLAVAGALAGAFSASVMAWAADGGHLPDVLDETLAILGTELGGIPPTG